MMILLNIKLYQQIFQTKAIKATPNKDLAAMKIEPLSEEEQAMT